MWTRIYLQNVPDEGLLFRVHKEHSELQALAIRELGLKPILKHHLLLSRRVYLKIQKTSAGGMCVEKLGPT